VYFTEEFDDNLKKAEPIRFVCDDLMAILKNYIPKNSKVELDKLATVLELYIVDVIQNGKIRIDPPTNPTFDDWGE